MAHPFSTTFFFFLLLESLFSIPHCFLDSFESHGTLPWVESDVLPAGQQEQIDSSHKFLQ
jgi:hypothetical protein